MNGIVRSESIVGGNDDMTSIIQCFDAGGTADFRKWPIAVGNISEPADFDFSIRVVDHLIDLPIGYYSVVGVPAYDRLAENIPKYFDREQVGRFPTTGRKIEYAIVYKPRRVGSSANTSQ